jgi:predicted AlkP superfamily phosphohydrolase/phosphomutase
MQTQTSTNIFFVKSNKKEKTEKKSYLQSLKRKKLTKVKNLLLLPRQWRQKTFLMAATLFLKMHSLGLQVDSDAAREVFPTRVT